MHVDVPGAPTDSACGCPDGSGRLEPRLAMHGHAADLKPVTIYRSTRAGPVARVRKAVGLAGQVSDRKPKTRRRSLPEHCWRRIMVVVPCWGAVSISSVPPIKAARSRILTRPIPRSASNQPILSGSNPMPSSCAVSRCARRHAEEGRPRWMRGHAYGCCSMLLGQCGTG
jgi:hypothetical protein